MGTAIGLSCIERRCQYRAKCNEITLSNIAIRKFNIYGGIKLGRDQPLELIREPSATYASRASRASHVIACHVYINITRLLLSEGTLKGCPRRMREQSSRCTFYDPVLISPLGTRIMDWTCWNWNIMRIRVAQFCLLSFFLFCFVLFF